MRSLKATAAAGLLGNPDCVCGAPYLPHTGETVWCSVGCSWSRGSGFDMLASHLGGYKEAVEVASALEPWMKGNSEFATELQAQRKMLELLLDTARQSSGRSMETVGVRESFHRLCKCRPHGVIHMNQEETLRLILLLGERDLNIPPGLHDRGASIITYWFSPHEPACLVVYPRGSRTFTEVVLRPCRYSWSGLHLTQADCAHLDVYPDFFTMAEFQEIYHTTLIDRVPTASRCSPLSADESINADTLRFLCPPGKWEDYLPAWSHIPGFEDSIFSRAPDERGGRLSNILATLLETLPSEKLLSMLSSMKLSEQLRRQIIESTTGHPQSNAIQECLSRVLLDLSDGIILYQSVGGYEIQRTQEDRKKVSNFTVNLKAIVGFDKLNEIFYEAIIDMGGETWEMELPTRCLEQPSMLLSAVLTGQIFQTPREGSAAVEDMKGMTRILRLLRRNTVTLPRLKGYRNLGWSHKQDVYVTPGFTVIAGGREDSRYRPVTDSDFFPYTPSPQPEDKPDITKLDPLQADLVSALVSCVIRSYHGLPVRLLPVVNSAEGRATLLQVFRAIGQTAGIRLTAVMQKHVDTLRGYPCLVTNVNDTQATALAMCGVRLAERGRILSGCGELAGKALAWALSEIASGLLADADVGFSEHKSVSMPNSFAQEGQRVLSRLFGSWPEARAEWRTLDNFLLEHGHDLEHKAHVCFEDDTVVLHKEILEGVDTQDLAIELGLLCRRAQLVGGEMIVDRNTLFPVLEEFYGQIPKIRLVKAPA